MTYFSRRTRGITNFLGRDTRVSRRPKAARRRCSLGLEFRSAIYEPLEERIMLDIAGANPPAIVVGRTLSAYDLPDVRNNQETITLTVYNQAADPISGVLLTDTLASGVTFATASQLPDQSGQELAWSLGTIQPFDRASVTLTVLLADPIPTTLDAGASAYGTLDAGMVSWTTAPATLRTTAIAANLLASTPDANTTDPFIQEKAAELNYDPTQIYNFLQNDIGYNSYVGSLRGARGTLWSNAGNSLDDASLGIALMRASGIPAQYDEGTLSTAQTQQLILSMFPASYQTVGYIPAGTPTADPANDPQLLSETKDHFWFQFDAGSGMTDADPEFAAQSVGQAASSPMNSFVEVPDNLRQKTEVRLSAEVYSQAAAAFGLSDGLSETVVLDRTFNDVDLVGRPLSIGNLVSSSAAGFTISEQTNTYSPYIDVGDEAFPTTHDQIIRGADYQEVLTNFPFSNQVLTGLFLNVSLSGPQGQSENYQRALFDRIGYAAREGLAKTQVSINPSAAPALTNLDVFTLNVLPGLSDPQPSSELNQQVQANAASLSASASSQSAAPNAINLATNLSEGLTRFVGDEFFDLSDRHTQILAAASDVTAYFDRPRLVLVSNRQNIDAASHTVTMAASIDLLRDWTRVVPPPGQSALATYSFNVARGLYENVVESNVVGRLAKADGQQVVNTATVFQAAAQQGIGLSVITNDSLAELNSLALPDEAKARITSDVGRALAVIVPDQAVTINGVAMTAWYELNTAIGELTGVTQDGGHQGLFEYFGLEGEDIVDIQEHVYPLAGIFAGFFVGTELAINFEFATFLGGNVAEAKAALQEDKQAAEEVAKQASEAAETFIKVQNDFVGLLGDLIGKQLSNESEGEEEKSQFEKNFKFMMDATVQALVGVDPPVSQSFINPNVGFALSANRDQTSLTLAAGAPAGAVQGQLQLAAFSVADQLTASWSADSTAAFQTTSLTAADATVSDAQGHSVGIGSITLEASTPTPVAVAGNVDYNVTGDGRLSFFGPAETPLGVSGNWNNYSATLAGNITLTVTTDGLALNGAALPAGTYTITTSSATLTGSGNTTSPNFAGSASVTAIGGTVELGPGSGNLSVGGAPINVTNETTLTGYNGTIGVSANGNRADAVTLNGDAANVLTVAPNPATLATDQNTAVSFNAEVQTSFADTYNLTAKAPTGWTVTIDNTGKVTVTPAPGTQTGTYPIQVIARSTTNSDLVAQASVEVTVTPATPGLTLAVVPDTQFTVAVNGAQLPTAFRATIQNTGPAVDTYNLSFSNVSAGFTILNSGTTVTVPAGETGILGIYLQPTGTQIPAPGTVVSFTVTATSATDSTITQTVVESFTMPAIDLVTISAPAQVTSTPGTSTTATLTLANAGNVPENVTLAAATPANLSLSGLSSVTLAVGQTITQSIALTPDNAAALNSTLTTTITATYGPAGSTQTTTAEVDLLVRSAQTVAISESSVDANSAGNAQLAGALSELSDTVALLQTTPTDTNLLSRTQLLLKNLSADLSADPALAPFVAQLAPIQANANAGDVADLLAALPTFFNNLDGVLAVEATQQFTVTLVPGEIDLPALANQQKTIAVEITDTGPAAVSLNLSTAALPSGVTASLGQSQITVQPGATQTVNLSLTSNLLSTRIFTVDVHAAASVVAHDATAVVAVRAAAADVLGVTANPITVNAGLPVAISASIFNTGNATRSVLAHIDILNAANVVVAAPADVPITLLPTAGAVTFDLGAIDTSTLLTGVYTARVSLRASDGSPLPGKTSEGPFLVGLPISASVSASPTTLPPGNSDVTTTITVSNQGTGVSSQVVVAGPQTAALDTGNNGEGTGPLSGLSPLDSTSPTTGPQTLVLDPQSSQIQPQTPPSPPTPPTFNPPAGDAVKWIGAASGNWNVAANWLDTTTNTNHVPDATDNVTIDAAGLTITVNSAGQAAQSLLVQSSTTLAITGGTLTIGSATEIDGTLTLANAIFRAAGGLVVALNGGVQWTSGTLDLGGDDAFNLGTMTLSNSLALAATNGANTSNLGGKLINEGTIVQQGGSLSVRDSIEIENTTQGTWQFAGDATIFAGSFSPTAVNYGVFQKTGGAGNSDIQLPLTSVAGTFESDSGTLRMTNSADTFADGVFNAGAGATVNLNTGATGMVFSGIFTGSGAGAVLLNGGTTFIGAGGASFNFSPGLFQWANATINLQGDTLTNLGAMSLGLANQGTGEGISSRDAALNPLAGSFINQGTLTEVGSTTLSLFDKVLLSNTDTGSVLFAGDGDLAFGGQTPSFTSAGTIEKTSGTGTSEIRVNFTYTGGPIKVDSGTLLFDTLGGQFVGTSFAVAAGATLDLAGSTSGNVFTGTFTGTGGGTVLLENGAMVIGEAGATFDFPAGMFQWTGGGINLDGHTLTNTGSMSLANPGNISLFANDFFTGANNSNLGGTFNNSGVMTESATGSLALFDSVAFNNLAGATLLLAGDAGLLRGNFSPTASNAGTIEKTSGNGTSTISAAFRNLGGALSIDSGTLALAGPTGESTGAAINVAAGATLDLTGGTDGNVYSGTYTGTGAGTVLLRNGAFEIGAAGATFNFPTGMFQWTGGGINLNGHSLTNLGVLSLANAGNVSLYGNGNFDGGPNTGANQGGTLDNKGTINEQGPASMQLFDSVVLTNEAGASINLSGGAGLLFGNSSSAVSNAGEIQVSDGAATSTISVPLTNTGTVDVVSGELDLTSTVSNQGTLDAHANTLKFTGAVKNVDVIQTEGGTLAFNEGNSQSLAVDNSGALVVNGGNATFSGPITQVISGFLSGGEWLALNGGSISLPANANIKFNEAQITLSGAGAVINGIQPLTTNDGSLSDLGGATFTTSGDFINNGPLTVGPDSTLSITGDYTQTAVGTLNLQLGGTPGSGHFGQLSVSGAATFAGVLRSEFVGGYTPSTGDDFTVATYGSTSGSFAAIELAEIPAVAYTANVGASALVLTSQAATLTATQTTLTSSAPNGANFGQLVQYAATVTAPGGGTPTGAVQFQIDGLNSGTPVALSGGQAALTIALPAGSHTITALYISDSAQFANSDNAAAPLVQQINATNAPPTTVELYYTTFSPGTVDKVSVTFDQNGLTLGTPVSIVQNIPADGLIFLPNGDLLTANGTASEINPNTGAVTSVNGQGAEHLSLDPSGTKVWTSPQPGNLVELPLNPLSNGIVHVLTGDDTTVTHLAFDPAGQAYYVSSSPAGFGSFGLIDLTTFTTKRIFSNLPAAHGISYDPYTGDLFLVGALSIVQIDPRTLSIVSERDFPTLGSVFDQGANDGKGHIYVANNGGYLAFVDYSGTGLVGDPSDFVATPFLAGALDDVAPLSGLGGAGIPVSIDHHLPATGYNVNPTSIAPSPASFSSSDVTWNATFLPGQAETDQFQFTGQVTNMAPGEVRQISTGTTVTATVTAQDGTQIPVSIQLPPVVVAAEHIIELTPPTETVDQGATATYTVELSNPLPTAEVYTLSIDGLPAGETAALTQSINVPAGATIQVPLTISVPIGAMQGTQAFVVSTQTADGASDSVEGRLTVTSQVVINTLAVHLTLAPMQAVAGQTNPAVYTLTVTNTGDTTDTYNLAASLPAGFSGVFSQTSITVPPGLSNFRDIQLAVTPPAGAAAHDYAFTVTATSTTDETVASQATSTATVLAQGVQVSITPSSAVPGSTYQLKVTNTGQATDTFNLSLANPGALISTLGTNQVTLAPGASQTVPVITSQAAFAIQGALPLTGVATSQTNAAVHDQATADLAVAPSQGMTAALNPAQQTLAAPGATSFLLQINNTGNSEDSYSATIIGTSGPITANLIGLDGQPTQSVPIFILPGLATGALVLQVNVLGTAQGTVTVLVQSLTNNGIKAAPTATITIGAAVAGELTLTNNAGLAATEGAAATVGSNVLAATDSDESITAAEIVYKITAAPTAGSLALNGQPLSAGGTFTQDDINRGRLSYKAAEEGSDSFGFTVTAGETASINGTVLIAISDPAVVATGGFTLSAAEGSSSSLQTVATFTDPGGFEPQASYAAQIDWGDGSSSAGNITLPVAGQTATVSGQHTYAEEGSYTVRITLHHEGAPNATATSTAIVSDVAVAASGGFTYSASEGAAATSQTVAVFTDPAGPEALANYSASIDWGDGTSATTGAISLDPNTHIFSVAGQHSYANDGTFSVKATLMHESAPAVTVVSSAVVANATTTGQGGIVATAVPVTGYEFSTPTTVEVATFTDGDGSLLASDFNATINWGDGSTSAGSIALSGATYTVSGSHQYHDEGHYTLTVTIAQTAGPLSEGATSATVSAPVLMHEELLAEGTVGTPDQKLIQEIYRDMFNRLAEPAGRQDWVGFLQRGVPRAAVAYAMIKVATDEEFQYDTVNSLYQQYLHRAPEAAGLEFWMAYLYSGGGTIEGMSEALLGSEEYFQTRGGGTVDGFLQSLFQDVLDRPIDLAALSYFSGLLANGHTRYDIASMVFSSDEYQGLRVNDLYEQLLHRPADAAALAQLTAALVQGVTDETIIADILSSDEYFAKAQL